jgi:hypothetical protein
VVRGVVVVVCDCCRQDSPGHSEDGSSRRIFPRLEIFAHARSAISPLNCTENDQKPGVLVEGLSVCCVASMRAREQGSPRNHSAFSLSRRAVTFPCAGKGKMMRMVMMLAEKNTAQCAVERVGAS